jgi:hypothetical protein
MFEVLENQKILKVFRRVIISKTSTFKIVSSAKEQENKRGRQSWGDGGRPPSFWSGG